MQERTVVNAIQLSIAYASARYTVKLDGDSLPLQVGQPATDLEAYWPATRYLFITAWNPASEPRSDTANAAADAVLEARLDAIGAARQRAWAEAPDGRWQEPGWVLADIDDPTADRLASEFGQAGVLAWCRGEPVRLRMSIERPDGHAPKDAIDSCIDWMGERVNGAVTA
ncbi:DUF3293 domain-containing protein [Lysobacter sp. A378]